MERRRCKRLETGQFKLFLCREEARLPFWWSARVPRDGGQGKSGSNGGAWVYTQVERGGENRRTALDAAPGS